MTIGRNGHVPWTGIGALIKRYREDQRVTQRELAAAAGISIGALRDLEQGRTRFPRWGTVEELAAVLGVGQVQRAELARVFRAGPAGASRHRGPHARRYRGVRIDILGPLETWRDGEGLALGSARQRAVLGLLALHAQAVVHRDTIIDVLWGQRPPTNAVAEVQGYVSRLRKMLGGGGTAADGPARDGSAELVATASGRCYRLNANPGQLDLAAFGELIHQAQDAMVRGDLGYACGRYEQALGLWRGDILADIDLIRDHPAATAATRRRAEAVLGYAEAAAHAAQPLRVLPYLRELCAREPLNEPAHARLMTTLAATGQQAAAIGVFTDVRRRLDTDLGILPSLVLTEAYARVLRQQSGPPQPPTA